MLLKLSVYVCVCVFICVYILLFIVFFFIIHQCHTYHFYASLFFLLSICVGKSAGEGIARAVSRSWRATLTKHLVMNADSNAAYEAMMQVDSRRPDRFDVLLLGVEKPAKIKYSDRGAYCDMRLIHKYFLTNDPISRIFQDEFVRVVAGWKNKDIRLWNIPAASLERINTNIEEHEEKQPTEYKRMGRLSLNDAKAIVLGPVEHETTICERIKINDTCFCMQTKDVNRKTTNSFIEHLVPLEDVKKRNHKQKAKKVTAKMKARKIRGVRGDEEEEEEDNNEEDTDEWDVAHIQKIYVCKPYSNSHLSHTESVVLLRVINYEFVDTKLMSGSTIVRALKDEGQLVPITAIKYSENIALWPSSRTNDKEDEKFFVVRLSVE